MLGAIKIVAGRIRALILWIFATLRRACCCFRRRRRNSESQPLTAIGVVPNNQPPEEVTQGWETWGREEDDVTRQIREYRTSLAIARQQQMQASEQQEKQEDFFQDMAPKITRPPRIALENNSDTPVTGNSLLLAPAPLPLGSELGAWAEEEGWEAEEQGWEEEVREQRRQQRIKRAEEMQNRRTEHRMGLGSRLS